MQIENPICKQILEVIESHGGIIRGSEALALELGVRKWWLIKYLRLLKRKGQISISKSNGGRGRKTTYTSREPGLPRRVRQG